MQSLESFNSEAQASIRTLLAASHSSAAVAGVITGVSPADLRPVVFEQGDLWIVRALRASDRELCRVRFLAAAEAKWQEGQWDWGELARSESDPHSFWVRRRYVPRTLDQLIVSHEWPESRRNYAQLLDWWRQIVIGVRDLHAAGAIHGHLGLFNIGIERERMVVLDPFVGDTALVTDRSAMLKSRAGFAPELVRQSRAPSFQSDSYGVGLIAQAFFPDEAARREMNRAQRLLLDALLEVEEAKRPSIQELAQAFLITMHSSSAQPVERRNDSSAITGGRKIGGAAFNEREDAQERAPKDSSVRNARSPFALIAVIFLALIGAAYWWWGTEEELPLEVLTEYWTSSQPTLMARVARDAVNGGENAQGVILDDSVRGPPREGLRARLLQVAFDPAWQADLSDQDRRAVFVFASMGLLRTDLPRIPPLTELHPAVALAVAVDLPLSSGGATLQGIPISHLARLPAPFGAAFEKLGALTAQTEGNDLSDARARAFLHLLFGNGDTAEAIPLLFGSAVDQAIATGYLLILLEVSTLPPEQWAQVLSTLAARSDKLGERALWFNQEKISEWAKVSPRTRMLLASGLAPDEELTFEQSVDLLGFPLTVVRQDAVSRLLAGHLADHRGEGGVREIVEFLGTPDNHLTRSQMIALLSLLQLKGEMMNRYVGGWFSTEPDPTSVAHILRFRKISSALDPLTARAVGYLKERTWSLAPHELASLAESPEPLVRALAYSKLDGAEATERAILEKALASEKNPRLKESLKGKLKDILAGE